MIIYDLNYLKWCCKKNFMNVKVVVFRKDIMELVNLDFHILHTLNLILFLIFFFKNGEYYTPRYEDQNVVPYHPMLLLVCGSHLNILHITSSYWSFYLLKYAMKCEPHGKLNLNTKNVE
jgi:hypothetical protein